VQHTLFAVKLPFQHLQLMRFNDKDNRCFIELRQPDTVFRVDFDAR